MAAAPIQPQVVAARQEERAVASSRFQDSSRDDGLLVVRVRRGEAAAFDALVRRHYRSLFAVALGLVGQPAEAEDICQDVCLRALEHIDDLRDPERFLPWVLQIARNTARNRIDYLRLRAADALEASKAAAAGDPRQDPARLALRRRLELALGELAETPRSVLLLYDLDGWDHRSISEQLGISELMSRQHLFQARRRLRALLDAQAKEAQSHER